MGSVDWGAVAAGQSGGAGVYQGYTGSGVDWSMFAPRKHHPAVAPENHFVGRYSANPNMHRAGGSLVGNFLGQTSDMISGIPGAAVGSVQAGWKDLHLGSKTVGAPGWDPGANIHEVLAELGIGKSHLKVVPDPTVPEGERGLGGIFTEQYWHDPHRLAGMITSAPREDINALRRGDWHYFQQHPLNPVLDIATVASVGGVGALRLARAGRLGEHAEEIATTERLIREGDVDQALNQARTLQGRIRQRAYDRWSMGAGRDNPMFGAPARMKRVLDKRVSTEMIRAHLPLRVFQRATHQLTAAEMFAFHVAAEGVPLEKRIAYYKARKLEIEALLTKRAAARAKRKTKTGRGRTPWRLRPIQQYLENLESDGVREALTNPRPEFIDALETGAKVEGEAGRRLMAADQLRPEAREERVNLPANMMEPPPPPPPPAAPTYSGPVTPPIVPAAGPATFTIRLPSRFYDAARDQGKLEGLNVSERKRTADNVNVRMDADAFRSLENVAKNVMKGHSTVLAARRRFLSQRHIMEDAVERSTQRLVWRTDRKTGIWRVEDSDYRVEPGQRNYEAYKAEDLLGHYRTLPEAKRAVERDAAYRRTEAANAEGVAKSQTEAAAGEADPFMSAIDEGLPHPHATAVNWSDHAPENPMRSSEDVVDHVLGRAGVPQSEREAQLQSEITDLRAQIKAGGPKKKMDKARMQLTSKESRLEAMQAGKGVYAENAFGEAIAPQPRDALDLRARQLIDDARTRPSVPLNMGGDIEAQLGEFTGGGSFTSQEWADMAQNELEKFYETRHQLGEQISKATGTERDRLERELKQRESAIDHIFADVDPEYAKLARDLHEPTGVNWADHAPDTHEAPATPVHEPHPANVTEPQAASTPPEPSTSVREEAAYTIPERNPAEVAAAGVNPVHPDFPAPFRFPHARQGVMPGQFMSPKTEAMLGKNMPLRQLRHNAGKLLSDALMITDPERVLSRDFLSTMRWLMIEMMQREYLDKIAFEPVAELAQTGYKRPQDYYYRPSHEATTTTPLPKHMQLEQGLTQDRSLVSSEAGDATLEDASRGIVTKNLSDLGLDKYDEHLLEKMNEQGIKVIHKAYGRDFRSEFKATNWAVRAFYDRPLDVWRMITLNYRPAWAINNFVGNGLMGLARYGPAGAAAYLRVLLSVERGDDKLVRIKKFRSIERYTMRIPTLRRKYGELFSDLAPEIHSAGLFGVETRRTHLGYHQEKVDAILAPIKARTPSAVSTVVKGGVRAVEGVGKGITRAEILFAEDTGREAAFILEAGGDLDRIREFARKAGEGNISLAEALKRMDRPSVERAVQRINDVLGDFNDLSHTERSILRRVIPFYSWYKVIVKVSAKYAARYPARLLLLKNIAEARDRTDEPPLPSWMEGALLVGGPSHGTQALLTTQGVNPYQTLTQLSQNGPGGLVSAPINSFVVGLTGREPTFGGLQDYYGPGATEKGGWEGFLQRYAGSFAAAFPPVSQGPNIKDTGNYEGKLYDPHEYHAGPLSVNDFLLQYMGLPLRHVRLSEARQDRGLK